MRLYPDVPRRRAATIAVDIATIVAVALFAWLGIVVHQAVEDLSAVATGVQEVGGDVQGALEQAGEAVGQAPIIGGEVSEALREAGQNTGGRAAAAGREGEQEIRGLADLLGWLTFAIPTVLVLAEVLPSRIAQIRRITAAAKLLRFSDATRAELMARRAAYGLPYATLQRYTDDPFGDLEAGRLDGLLSAAMEEAGIRYRR